ncbi:grasp-with-spasm system ATP-grasp peptide maturase [Aureispira sp. CCB-QB1]|uniref:grasp-with-spasm system ATP-grasp peptide maturase n=1 Tax=Aureispira sp. CCB-QB1 TaxID=1313421 RepID=UPI000697C108|nr:grasp-with-spasm system ATP-grasp peptide maturase [Aureispira sp. CCB-QB1]
MILIITVVDDWSTNDIIDWLGYKEQQFFRLNIDEREKYHFVVQLENSEQVVTIFDAKTQEKLIASNEVTKVWFRRSARFVPEKLELVNNELEQEIRKAMFTEMHYFMRAVYEVLGLEKDWLNYYETATNDKINTLIHARNIGLSVPDTILTTSKKAIETFHEKHSYQIIIKAIYNVTHLPVNEDEVYVPYTAILTKEDLDALEHAIFPSLCQEYLDKEYELRVFYMNGQFYSMAIFSQQDEQTKIDFRVYNYAKPNRRVPYNLPIDIEKKCEVLMQTLNLNSGSLDFVKTRDGRWVFLEVNPVGQFGMTSYPCNYHIEHKIANFLSSKV